MTLFRRASRACSPGCRPTPPGSRRRWTRPDLPPVPCGLSPVPCDLSPVTNTLSPPPLNLTKYTAVMQHIQTFRYYCILTTVPHMMQCLEPVYQSTSRVPGVLLQCPKVTCTLPPCLPVSVPRVQSCPGQTCCSRHVAAHEIHPLHCGKWCSLNPTH